MTSSLVIVSMSAPGCLGRSDLDDPDLERLPDGGIGTGGVGGKAIGSGGKSSSVGGAGGGTSVGGSGGFDGAGGSFGSGGSTGGSGGTGGNPACNPTNCKGCCDAAFTCRDGDAINACGLGGVECLNCAALGFGCVGGGCEGPPPVCGPATCKGCCDGQGLCRFGTETDACGTAGGTCEDCGALGEGCVAGKCEGPPPPTCGPQNCGGCCDNAGTCRAGTSDSVCGGNGVACQSCSAAGRVCTQPGNYCAFFPSCGSVTCPSGCCDQNGACRNGRSDAACGSSGQNCSDCAANGQACASQGFCYTGTHCGPDNCAGCCTSNGQCGNGTLSLSCGQFGALCDNCFAKGQTCQNRICSDGSTCPAAYPGCNPSSVTPPPVSSAGCSNANLDGLIQACKGADPPPSCSQYFQQLLQSSPRCYDCMLQFAGPDAYTRCVTPFLTQTCNHDLTCAIECQQTSCGDCSPSEEQACQEAVFAQNGQCRPFTNGYYCLQAALNGPGKFCDFDQYNDVGLWWSAVGRQYCQ